MHQSAKLSEIRIDGGTQARAELNEAVVSEYAEAIADGAQFPPAVLFFDGSAYWLADGFHRFHAFRKAGKGDLPADVRQGTRRDAILYSVGANANHGLRRSNADKRKAVLTLLNDPEWSKWSDREIARRAGVSNNFVSGLRSSLSSDDSEPRSYTTKHGTVAQMDTSRIGKVSPAEPKAEAPVHAVMPAARREPEADAGGELTEADRIAELEEANRFLEGEVERLNARIKTFEHLETMYRDWTVGGWEKVVQAKDDLIAELQRTAQARIARESSEKVRNLNAMRHLSKKLEEEGKGRDFYIDIEDAAHG